MNLNELVTGGKRMLKMIEGHERLVVTLGFVLSGIVTLLTGQDMSQWLDLGARALGMTDPAAIAEAKSIATQIVPLLVALYAAWTGLKTRWKQYKAGATASEIGSPAGAIKAAVASGDLVIAQAPVEGKAATLEMAGEPVVAKVGDVTVVA